MAAAKLPLRGRNLVKRMLAADKTVDEINAALEKAKCPPITEQAICYYRKSPVVKEAKLAAADEIKQFGIAQRVERVRFQDQRWEACRSVIRSRKEAAQQQVIDHERYQAEIEAKRAERDAEDDHSEDWKMLDAQLRRLEDLDPGPLHPGQETGLLVQSVTYTKQGRRVEWAVDTALLNEIDKLEKHSATDTGDWTEKRDVTSAGQPVTNVPVMVLRGVSMDDL